MFCFPIDLRVYDATSKGIFALFFTFYEIIQTDRNKYPYKRKFEERNIWKIQLDFIENDNGFDNDKFIFR